MKKTFITLLCIMATTMGVLNATDNSKHFLIADFFNSLKQSRHAEFLKYVNTPIQQEAMEYIINPSKMYAGKSPSGADPHTKAGVQLQDVKIPYWTEATKLMHKSAKNENNPISANVGVVIIKSYLGKNNKEYIGLYKDMVEVLAKAKTCNGLIEYADVLEQGIGTPVNVQKAYATTLEAKKECDGISSKWQETALQIKINRLEKLNNVKK